MKHERPAGRVRQSLVPWLLGMVAARFAGETGLRWLRVGLRRLQRRATAERNPSERIVRLREAKQTFAHRTRPSAAMRETAAASARPVPPRGERSPTPPSPPRARWVSIVGLSLLACATPAPTGDRIRDLQIGALRYGRSATAHWGPRAGRYVSWRHHTNRLVPVYTFGTRGARPGVDLDDYSGPNSPYRRAAELRRIYGELPQGTLNPRADYLDQTNLADLQRAAAAAGRRHIFLIIFDGMGWHVSRAAAVHAAGRVGYSTGRGSGLHFLDYRADGTTQFGSVVVAPLDARRRGRAETQEVYDTGSGLTGGYDAGQGGPTPWTPGTDPHYVTSENYRSRVRHAVTDSAAAGTALCSGRKTYYGAVNVDHRGRRLPTVAHELQARGFAVGVVTNVPLSHATPASAYAHNVTRWDYQDLSRDLLGLPSVSHPHDPLPGLDVLIGCGAGVERRRDRRQGKNFVPGNRYLTDADLLRADATRGGSYIVARRTPGVDGGARLATAAAAAAQRRGRLLGFFGVEANGGHLPYRTADADYEPTRGRRGKAERYREADLHENPSLAEMTTAALTVLEQDAEGFWLMVEAGDVDWANHDANLDNSIGAVISGDAAVRVITAWVEAHSDWNESLMIVTADHAHYLMLPHPEGLLETGSGRP